MINKARCACVQPQQQQCGAARQGWWMWLGHLAKALSLTNYNPVSESQWIISFAQPVVVCSPDTVERQLHPFSHRFAAAASLSTQPPVLSTSSSKHL